MKARGVVKVAKIVGEVYQTDVSSGLKTRLALNSLVVDGQVIETGQNSYVVLVLSNGAIVNVKGDSRLEIDQFLQNPFAQDFKIRSATHEPSTSATRLILRKGEIFSQVKKLNREAGSSFTVETPVGAAGIRGTAFRVAYVPFGRFAQYTLSMAEGLIRFSPFRGKSLDVPAGKEVSFLTELDSSQRPVSISETVETKDVTGANQATMQQALTEALGAAISVEFPAASGPAGQFSTGTPTTTETATPSTGTGGSSTDSDGALAAPAAVPPAQRTTPPDGTSGS